MNEKLKQKLREEIVKLPKEHQNVINAFDWGKISEEVGNLNLLDEDEIKDLQTEVGLVLVGLEDQDLLALNIENNVGTSKIEAIKITAEVNQQIFKPMLEQLELLAKNNLNSKNQSWNQRINFIVSGGDYSSFMEK